MTAFCALKRYLYAILFLLLLCCAFPASALESDTQAPVISFPSDAYFRGYPVIYARDTGDGSGAPEFTGFSVSDDITPHFADMTFLEVRLLPGQGMVRVAYDGDALKGFSANGEGEVEIIASDAAGNTTSVKAWCIVKPIDPPYYADAPDNPKNERENRVSISIPLEAPYAFYREDFLTERLVSKSGLAALHIDALPDGGTLSFYTAGEFVAMGEQDLPKRVAIWDIHAGKLVYTPNKSGADAFLFRLEDTEGNIALTPSAMDINVENGPMLINGVEDIEVPVNAQPFTFDISIDASNAGIHLSSIDAQVSPSDNQARNAAVSAGYVTGSTWRVSVSPVPNMSGACEYNITAKSGEDIAVATFTLNIAGENEGAAVLDEAADISSAPNPKVSELTIDVPIGGEWARSAAVSAVIANHEAVASVKLIYANGPYSGAVAYVLQNAGDGVFNGAVYAVGRYTLVVTDVRGGIISRSFEVKNVNSIPATIDFDRSQLIDGAFNSRFLSVNISCATDVADVRILSGGVDIEGARVEQYADGEYRLYFEELYDTEVTVSVTDAQGLVSALNLGKLTLDTEPPAIEADFPNEDNAYYLPRLVRVTDSSRTETVTRLLEHSPGVYALQMSIGADAVEEITAKDSFGNESKLTITMLSIPDPRLIKLFENPEEIRETVAKIYLELDTIGDKAYMTAEERRELEQILEALLWEADALSLLQSEGMAENYSLAQSLLLRLPGISILSEDIAQEFLLRYMIASANEHVANVRNSQEGIGNEFLRALEDVVIQCTLLSGQLNLTPEIEELLNVYENLAAQIGISDNNEVAFLVGMMSRVDYTPAIGNEEGFVTYFTIEETDQMSLLPPDEDSFFIGAVDLKIVLEQKGAQPETLSFLPGNQGFLCVRAVLDSSLYDLSTLRMMRVSETESVEIEILRTEPTDSGAYLFLPLNDTGRLELYAQMLPGMTEETIVSEEVPIPEETPVQEEAPIQEEASIQEEAPEPEQEQAEPSEGSIAPEPMQDALNQNEQDTESEPKTEAPDVPKAPDVPPAKEEALKPPEPEPSDEIGRPYEGQISFTSTWALYIIVGGTLLIVLLRVVAALKRNAKD